MKIIGAKNLQKLMNGRRFVSERDVLSIFNKYGDEFDLLEGKRVSKNKLLEEKLQKDYVDIGDRI